MFGLSMDLNKIIYNINILDKTFTETFEFLLNKELYNMYVICYTKIRNNNLYVKKYQCI